MDADDPARDAQMSDDERLAECFYTWELRGRGWQLWDHPVEPQPPFRPFFGHYVNAPVPADDARKNTVISGALDWLHRKLTGKSETPADTSLQTETPDEPEPAKWEDPGEQIELRLSIPSDMKISLDGAEHFLLSIASCAQPVTVEFIGLPDSVVVQLACVPDDADTLRRQLEAHFPEAVVTPAAGLLRQVWQEPTESEVFAEFGLSREFMLPLAVPSRAFAADPLIGVIGALAGTGAGEAVVLQITFQPTHHPWAESILRSVTFADGTAFFEGGRDYLKLAREKISRPMYAAVVRVAARAAEPERAWELARGIGGGLTPLNNPEGNELFPLDNDGYDADDHREDFLRRRCRRSGMLLNSAELASLVHLPSSSVQVPKLRQKIRRSKQISPRFTSQGVVLGVNEHGGISRSVKLSHDERSRHLHVIGASGTGKSTLLLNLIVSDLNSGDGLAVLDPHGDLIDAALEHIPPERVGDVILIDPADEDYPVGFNVLSAHSALEKNLLASDLVAVFRRLATSWGDQMNAVLGNAILAFLENPQGGTLVDLRRFLVEPGFRKRFLSSVTDPDVVYYWAKEFPLLTGRPQGPVLTRLDTFLRPKPIRHMVAQKESRLDFGDILDEGRILLARLSHGAIGAENAHLLGTLIVSKLHQMALGRQRVKEEERRFFSLYIDEFHNFATPSMASILSGVRKYKLGLVLAHQELRQLDSVPEVSAAVLSNAHTRICFRLGDEDAKRLESGFSAFSAADLQNLGTGEAICRIERADLDFNLKTSPTPKSNEQQSAAIREEVTRRSRERYAIPKAEVEGVLLSSRSDGQEADAATPPTPKEPEVPEEQRPKRQPRPNPETPPPRAAPAVPPPPMPQVEDVAKTPATPPAKRSSPTVPGRGGPLHQEIQRQIKAWAEGIGYKATIEGQVLGSRAADVALEKGDISIAVELCVTTEFVHELGNIRKCLDAGFQYAVALSPDPERLAKLRGVVEQQLDEAELERVRFFSLPELFQFVLEHDSQTNESKTVRGYKVKTSYRPAGDGAGAARQQAVSQVIAQAMKRLRERGRGE